VGPDAPVYLWWSRLAGVEGLSAIANRPGAPALSLVLEGTLGLSVVQATAALEGALGVAVGLSSAALVRRRTGASGSALAGLLAGTFAVHLAAGYVANLITTAAFLAAGTLLDGRTRRAAVLAAFVLAGGGLAHPQFLLVCVAILLVAAATAWRTDRREAVRLAGSALGGGAVLGIGLLAVQPGAPPLEVDTSKDAFLRRAGLADDLRNAFFDRFLHRWTRYVQWVSVPLAIVGFAMPGGNAGRILRSWFVLTAAGVVFALATGWLPADRFVTFGFAIPILAALGLVRMWRRLMPRRALAVVVTVALTLTMLAGSAIAWNRQEPFLSEEEVGAMTTANRFIAGTPPGGVLRFTVNADGPEVTFLATRAANVIRAGVPPERIWDVFVIVPKLYSEEVSETRKLLTRLTYRDARRAEAGRDTERQDLTFVLRAFDPVGYDFADLPGPPESEVAPGVQVFSNQAGIPDPALVPVDPLTPSSAAGIVWASIATLALLGIAGYGWARMGLEDAITAAASAPAVGAAVLILVATSLDAIGVRLGTVAAVVASALAGCGGFLGWFVLERRARTRSAPQIEEQPAE
jgi:hypothetical protein